MIKREEHNYIKCWISADNQSQLIIKNSSKRRKNIIITITIGIAVAVTENWTNH